MERPRKNSAFTLIELLVVISIILIASSILFVAGGGGDGAKLSTAQRIVSGIAQGARGQALLKGAPTRLIIYSDNAGNLELDKKLRFFGIVYWAQERNPTTGAVIAEGWKAATQGTFLPEGIYFNPALGDSSGSIPTMTLEYPRRNIGNNTNRANGGAGEEYYFYEFRSNGTMATSSAETLNTDFTNTWLALQAGALMPDSGGVLTVQFPATEPSLENLENLKVGLIFRRGGTVTMVTDPADLN